MAKTTHSNSSRGADDVAYLDFSFFLPMEERLRAEHIQDAVKECCEIRPEDGTVVIDEFAPTQRNESLCVKGYVATSPNKQERIMRSLNTQFSRNIVTNYLMELLEIEYPILRIENFMCHFASEGPMSGVGGVGGGGPAVGISGGGGIGGATVTSMATSVVDSQAELLELEQGATAAGKDRYKNTIMPSHEANIVSSSMSSSASSSSSSIASSSKNKGIRNNDNGRAPSDPLYPIEEMNQLQDTDPNDPNKQDMSFLDDAEFEDPNLPLGKKFESFRKLLEQYIDDCENMYDQLLQECDQQIQQNY